MNKEVETFLKEVRPDDTMQPLMDINRFQRALLIRYKDALEFYAKGKGLEHEYDTPDLRREFGCGCCAGTNDSEGMLDFDRAVIGLTAREALDYNPSE